MWDQFVQFVQEQIQNNELFKGGLLLMVGGALLALIRPWPTKIWTFIKRQSMVVIDIPDRDKAFKWVNLWLANHEYSKNWARLLTIKTEQTDGHSPNIIFSPAPGAHWFWYKRRLVILNRERQNVSQGDTGVKDPFREYFTIRILGRGRGVVQSLINDAYNTAHPDTRDRVCIHRTSGNYTHIDWYSSNSIVGRPIESVILPEETTESLIEDIKEFKNSEDWYIERGLPYRRGYLFYGPPGNGKTSIIVALAAYFKMDIAILSLKKGADDDSLSEALSDVPTNSIVLLEDIDCIVAGRETEESKSASFSGLLNALDGLNAAHGQIVFMTTNHKDKLDPALIRPGRCDFHLELTNADEYQKEKLFNRFYPESKLGKHFAQSVQADISMAELQQHFMKYRHSPESAIQNAIDSK